MKKTMYYAVISAVILFSLVATGCDKDKNNPINAGNNDIIEGPSSGDVLTVPTDDSYLGDSIRIKKTFTLSDHQIHKVTASTTQNGHIAVLGGYRDVAVVYVYAKPDNDNDNLSDEQIDYLLEKYYNVEAIVSNNEIIANITERTDVIREDDYCNLRVSIKIFSPQNVSTSLNIARGSIFVNNARGQEHSATSISGAIKYMNSYGRNFAVNSQSGYIGMINSSASEIINTNVTEGSIQLVLPEATTATLDLQSSRKVNAYILNASNFNGERTLTKVKGDLNGGGYKINATSVLGVINLRWYENN